ncbi:MAG: VOC family protein [Myxococcales bacterium]
MAQVDPVPKDMHTVTTNLVVRDCAKAIEFYQRALGAREVMRMQAPDGKSIWHAHLKVGDTDLFLNDEMPGMSFAAPTPDAPAPVSMWLYVSDCDAAFRQATAAGGTSTMEPQDMFWGDRCAGILDPFGYSWSFATHQKDMSEEEMRREGEKFAQELQAQASQPT